MYVYVRARCESAATAGVCACMSMWDMCVDLCGPVGKCSAMGGRVNLKSLHLHLHLHTGCTWWLQENKVMLEARPIYAALQLPPTAQFQAPPKTGSGKVRCVGAAAWGPVWLGGIHVSAPFHHCPHHHPHIHTPAYTPAPACRLCTSCAPTSCRPGTAPCPSWWRHSARGEGPGGRGRGAEAGKEEEEQENGGGRGRRKPLGRGTGKSSGIRTAWLAKTERIEGPPVLETCTTALPQTRTSLSPVSHLHTCTLRLPHKVAKDPDGKLVFFGYTVSGRVAGSRGCVGMCGVRDGHRRVRMRRVAWG